MEAALIYFVGLYLYSRAKEWKRIRLTHPLDHLCILLDLVPSDGQNEGWPREEFKVFEYVDITSGHADLGVFLLRESHPVFLVYSRRGFSLAVTVVLMHRSDLAGSHAELPGPRYVP